MSRAAEEKKRRRLLRLIRTGIVCLTAFAVALAFCIFPYRALLPAAHIPARGEGELRVHFLSVGQGDCTIVEFPSGKALVVDAGDGSFEANDTIVSYIKGLDCSSLLLAVTHADIDHYGGARELLCVFSFDCVYLPVLPSGAPAYESFLDAVLKEGCARDTLVRYDAVEDASGAYAVCISPHAAGETEENVSSAMLYVSYGGVNILLSGDADAVRERAILSELALSEDILDSGRLRVRLGETDVLKVAHHGAASASCEEWLSMLSPAAAIVSCGAGNFYRHPAGETTARLAAAGAEIYRTDEQGHILLTVRDGTYTLQTHIGG